MRKLFLLGTWLLVCGSALAQGPLGKVGHVKGAVLSKNDTASSLATSGAPLQEGMQLVTTSRSTAVVEMNGGCQVKVPPGHGLKIRGGLNCAQLTKSVVPVIPDVAATQPWAPPPKVLDKVSNASPVAKGVLEQLIEDRPISPN